MRNALIVITLLAFTGPAYGIRFVVQDPCAAAPWLDTEAEGSVGHSLGAVTVATLERESVPFLGNDHGINAIKGTIVGDQALEIVSDNEMRAYGWCFQLNGREPNLYAHQVYIGTDADVVYWYFGFAHFLDGTWISNCTPTHIAIPEHICGPSQTRRQ